MTLDEILLPDTPAVIRDQYATYASLAETKQFSLLEREWVILDTETTGLSFNDCELIEIAAAKVEGNQVRERFHTFVHPTGNIPAHIQKLTGIKDVDVTDAPSAKEAVAALTAFVDGLPVVAHAAAFDRGFIQRVPGGSKVSDTWIDSLQLSRIALPRLKSHKLQDMAEAFGCDSVTHRATDDVDALAGMWRVILVGLSFLPKGLLTKLSQMHEEVSWPYRDIFSYVAQSLPDEPFSFVSARSKALKYYKGQAKDQLEDERSQVISPTARELEAYFAPGGPLDSVYEAYVQRPEQMALAEQVRRAFDTSTHRAIEAGTGVGKTIGYLLPAILFAKKNNVGIGVATKTNTLTDQITSHELPLLDKIIPGGVSYFSLKGYRHYLCMQRMMESMKGNLPEFHGSNQVSQNTVNQDLLNALALAASFAVQSPFGDIDSLGIKWKTVPRDFLTVSAQECSKHQCPFYNRGCFVHEARRRANTCDVVVTNHSLLLRDIAMDGVILPSIKHWIVDEAHSFESEARKQWALELSVNALISTLKRLSSQKGKGSLLQRALIESESLDNVQLVSRLVTSARSDVDSVTASLNSFIQYLGDVRQRFGEKSSYSSQDIWISDEVRLSDAWQQVVLEGRNLQNALDELLKTIRAIHEQLNSAISETGKRNEMLTPVLQELGEALLALDIITSGEDRSYVYSCQFTKGASRSGKGGDIKLRAEKVDIGSSLGQNWLPDMFSVIYSSATMDIGDDFQYFDQQAGLLELDRDLYENISLSSSFDYKDQMESIVVKDLPAQSSERYVEKLADMIYDIHVAMEGSCLTLFTNRRDMEAVAKLVQPRLQEKNLNLLVQGKNMATNQVTRAFLDKKDSSLFALKSFWEGFDATGDTLRCVIIVKLPFASPSEPLNKERNQRDNRSWWHYDLPEAIIGVKQAAGRLVRSETDHGVLVLCDSRLVTKGYGRKFLDALPVASTVLSSDHVGDVISMWRKNHEK